MAAQLNEAKFKLKYLFIAEFEDGTKLEQTEDDVSSLDPQRSQFYDALQKGKIIKFSISGHGHTVSVDLLSGFFDVDGFSIMAEGDKLPGLPDRFDLIFYRQHTHNVNTNYDSKTGKELDTKETSHTVEYFIGWECELAGKKYKQKLAIV